MKRAIRVFIYGLLIAIFTVLLVFYICARPIVEAIGKGMINNALSITGADFQLYRFYIRGIKIEDIYIPEGELYLLPLCVHLKGLEYGKLYLPEDKVILEAYFRFPDWRFRIHLKGISVSDINKVSDILKRFGITEGLLNGWVSGTLEDGYIRTVSIIDLEDIVYNPSSNRILDFSQEEFQRLYRSMGKRITIDFTYSGKISDLGNIENYRIGPQTIKTFGITAIRKVQGEVLTSNSLE